MRVDVRDPSVSDALSVRLLVSVALAVGSEATARIVAPPAFAAKSFQVTLDAHGQAG